jgi:hypothetical protein
MLGRRPLSVVKRNVQGVKKPCADASRELHGDLCRLHDLTGLRARSSNQRIASDFREDLVMAFKEELAKKLDTAYAAFCAAIAGLDDADFARSWMDGGWGVREVVAHLAGWHRLLAGGLERMAHGDKPVPPGQNWSDPQPFNRQFVKDVDGKSQVALLDGLDAAVGAFKLAAIGVPDDRFRPGSTGERMFQGVGIEHFGEHTAAIEAWRRASVS